MARPDRVIAGHLWTIGPTLLHGLSPRSGPPSAPWNTTLEDPVAGEVALNGLLGDVPASDACLLVVHGLGGTADTHYCIAAAWAAEKAGISCLRLSLRGADRSGHDFYHAGLTADLAAAISDAALARFGRLYVLGYSLGGHVTLRYGLEELRDTRVRAVAAVCAPLDLDLSATAIDRRRAILYRRHVLAGLNEIYRAVARERQVPTPVERVLSARTIREWDGLTVVPRYGFGSVDNYYRSMSVARRLGQLSLPALLVQTHADPMVPPWTYASHLPTASRELEVWDLPIGGHVGFPAQLRFPDGSFEGPETRVLRWLLEH